MQNFSERESLRPFPPPFIMHALKLLKGAGLSDAKKQKIAALMLKYHKKCLSEEAEFVDGMIEILEKPE